MEVTNGARENWRAARNPRRVTLFATAILSLCQYAAIEAPSAYGQQAPGNQNPSTTHHDRDSGLTSESNADAERQTSAVLRRMWLFHEAIPRLLAAREQPANEYAA